MARDDAGQFTAKQRKEMEDFAPELVLERFWNVKHFLFKLNSADSAAYEVTSFNTGMEIDEEIGDMDPAVIQPISRKWVIKGAVYRPESTQPWGAGGMTDLNIIKELNVSLRKPMAGQGTDFSRLNPGVIGQSMLSWCEGDAPATEQAGHIFQWPVALDILTPTPVWAERLEICAATGVDGGGWHAVAFVLSILYGWAPAYINDILAGRQLIGG